MEEVFFDDIVDLVEEMPAEYVNKVLRNISKEKRLNKRILGYPEDSAGSVMTIEYVSLLESYTVSDALEHIQNVGQKRNSIFVLCSRQQRRLMGIVSLEKLVTADPNTLLKKLWKTM